MKILFVSNLYPPHHLGGYEMLCHEVATHLTTRGHHISVLTSTYGISAGAPDVVAELDIYRQLVLESDLHYYRPQHLLRYWATRRQNSRAVHDVIARVAPDLVMVWGMWNLSPLVTQWIETLAGPKLIYYLADDWPVMSNAHESYWEEPAQTLRGRLFKRLFRLPARLIVQDDWEPVRLRFANVLVCSQTLKDKLIAAGAPVEQAQVLYHGIDPAPYREAALANPRETSLAALRVVYVGALVPHKGVHTVVEALGHLKDGVEAPSVTLTVLGAGHPEYEAHLRQLVVSKGIEDNVSFHQPIPRSELPAFLANYDVLVLPSVYEEPQARISQEAMAAGLVLVATLTGGTKEIMVDEVNGLAFAPEDAQGLAGQLTRLAADAQLRRRLTAAAWQTVSTRFTITHMIDELETCIGAVVAS